MNSLGTLASTQPTTRSGLMIDGRGWAGFAAQLAASPRPMSSGGGVAAGVIITLLVVGLGGWYLYKRYIRWKRQQQLHGWAGDTISYLSLDGGTRNRSTTASSMSDITFSTYVNTAHGFEVMYPKEWSCIVSSTPGDPVVVQFVCPLSERTYKRFSVVRR